MNMKPLITAATAMMAIHCSTMAYAADDLWTSDFEAAKKEAATSKKSLIMDFTGSDWCGFCIALDKEVFSQDEFKSFAKENFVPVVLDFPRDTSKLSKETIEQNEKLQQTYGIQGYPTILLTDEEGKPFASTGYRKGGAEPYVKHLKELIASREKRDAAFKKADDAKGVDKAKALVEGIQSMELSDELVNQFYKPQIEAIAAADPDDETGFVKEQKTKENFVEFQNELNEAARKGDLDEAHKVVDQALKEEKFTKDDTQQVMLIRAMIFAQQQKFDESLKALDAAKAFAPDTELAKQADEIKGRIAEAQKDAEKKGDDGAKDAGGDE